MLDLSAEACIKWAQESGWIAEQFEEVKCVCETKIENDDLKWVQCDKCYYWSHAYCSGFTEAWADEETEKRAKYICQDCDPGSTRKRPSMEEIKRKLAAIQEEERRQEEREHKEALRAQRKKEERAKKRRKTININPGGSTISPPIVKRRRMTDAPRPELLSRDPRSSEIPLHSQIRNHSIAKSVTDKPIKQNKEEDKSQPRERSSSRKSVTHTNSVNRSRDSAIKTPNKTPKAPPKTAIDAKTEAVRKGLYNRHFCNAPGMNSKKKSQTPIHLTKAKVSSIKIEEEMKEEQHGISSAMKNNAMRLGGLLNPKQFLLENDILTSPAVIKEDSDESLSISELNE